MRRWAQGTRAPSLLWLAINILRPQLSLLQYRQASDPLQEQSLLILRPGEEAKFPDAYPADGEQSDGGGPGGERSQSRSTRRKAGPALITGHKRLRIQPTGNRTYTSDLR